MVIVDPSSPVIDIDGLRLFAMASSAIAGWWNHIPSVFLVMGANPAEAEGPLQKPVWQWVRSGPRSEEPVGDHG